MPYDIIIIGAGAAGLFTAANVDKKTNSLIINNTNAPGKKLLAAGAGQCNFTNTGNIKEFIGHYGEKGNSIRKALYKFSNNNLIEYMEHNGIECFKREDGKVFPNSLKGTGILNMLLRKAENNGFRLINNKEIIGIEYKDGEYILITNEGDNYRTRKLVIATGGVSYPKTGSNGSILDAIRALGIKVEDIKEALVPLFVEGYPFSSLSGISFIKANINIEGHQKTGGLLLTHKNFSGPVILDLSRYAKNGKTISINYLGDVGKDKVMNALKSAKEGNSKKSVTTIYEVLFGLSSDITKRFVELSCTRAEIDGDRKYAELGNAKSEKLAALMTEDTYMITGNGGMNVAMCTAGGVSLDEVDLNNFEVKKYPGLYVVGEALDVDGDTGGYNIQFAFTSGYICAKSLGDMR